MLHLTSIAFYAILVFMQKPIPHEENNPQPKPPSDILGTISYAQQNEILRTFDPHGVVFEYLDKLPPREKLILGARYGLEDGTSLTLEEIGKKVGLTRERIRQIEKDALSKLRELTPPDSFRKVSDLVFQFIEDRGNIAEQQQILAALCPQEAEHVARQCFLFILHVGTVFSLLETNAKYHTSWFLAGLDLETLDALSEGAEKILESSGKPIALAELTRNLRSSFSGNDLEQLSDDAIESYLLVSKKIGRNPFGEFGLAMWSQIRPRDVGDKAFLVLSHIGKPEHYAKITDLINKQGFDKRTALKESVHNELIKDPRFVLVGRGIYGLADWGYRPGVVADIITDLIAKADRPLSKEEIISGVLKQRVVKRNTIVVGLSNKNKFLKTPENRYTNA